MLLDNLIVYDNVLFLSHEPYFILLSVLKLIDESGLFFDKSCHFMFTVARIQ